MVDLIPMTDTMPTVGSIPMVDPLPIVDQNHNVYAFTLILYVQFLPQVYRAMSSS